MPRGFHITFDERVPKFVRKSRSWRRNLAIWSRSYQSFYELRHEVVNYIANFATISWTSWSKVMANLENWISLFRDKQDQKTYDFIFQTLVTNQFTSKLQLKLLTSEQLDYRYMFSKDLPLGAKALLVYHVDLLKDESPLPMEKLHLIIKYCCVTWNWVFILRFDGE